VLRRQRPPVTGVQKKELKWAANAGAYEFLAFGKRQFQLTTKE